MENGVLFWPFSHHHHGLDMDKSQRLTKGFYFDFLDSLGKP